MYLRRSVSAMRAALGKKRKLSKKTLAKYPHLAPPKPRGERNTSTTRLKRPLLTVKNPRCHYCTVILTRKSATADHVVPLSAGGANVKKNIVLACKTCNNRKGSMSYQSFMRLLAKEQYENGRTP